MFNSLIWNLLLTAGCAVVLVALRRLPSLLARYAARAVWGAGFYEGDLILLVDLDQLAAAFAPISGLVRTRAPRFAIVPQARLDHHLA